MICITRVATLWPNRWLVRDNAGRLYRILIDHVHAGNTTFWAYPHQLEAN